jgi:competence protein ComFC
MGNVSSIPAYIRKVCAELLRALMYVIAPAYCAACRVFLYKAQVLCSVCVSRIHPVVSVCLQLKMGYTLTVHAVSSYAQPVRGLILAKNSSNYTASKHLAQLMWQHSVLKHLEFDYLVPVPAHWTRTARRGYNQAVVIAQELSRLSSKPIFWGVKRSKKTRFQALLNAYERQLNTQGAFGLTISQQTNEREYRDKVFVLVDDLMTTGSTLQALGNTLIQVKPKAVYALVACRVV